MGEINRQRIMQKLLISFLCLLFLIGCKEDFPTYSSFCAQEKKIFNCLHYAIYENKDKKQIEHTFHLPESTACPYRVELTKYYVGKCNNPIVKSIGGDFYGYVRLVVKIGFKCYYKVQCDFKDDVDAAFERVLKQVEIDINQQNYFN
jgi:hypothetical protein